MRLHLFNKRNKKDSASQEKSAGESGRRSFFSRWRRRLLLFIVVFLAVTYCIGLLLNLRTGKMKGFNVASEVVPVAPENLRLLFDVTGTGEDGEWVTDHKIFDALLGMIEEAESEIIIDMFLVNRFDGDGAVHFHRDITAELVEALVAAKERNPDLFILFITDMINSSYREACPSDLKPLEEAGVHVVLTDLNQLPDSNFVYSPFYRTLGRFAFLLGPIPDYKFLTNPFDADGVELNLRQLSRLFNFKANHRKTASVRDKSGNWKVLITSANPHSASSAHGNVGVVLDGQGPLSEIILSEYNIARATLLHRPELYFGPWAAVELLRELESRPADWPAFPGPYLGEKAVGVQYFTEEELGLCLDRMLSAAGGGDRIEMMMFYLADPTVIDELKAAVDRGAQVSLLLDPNKDAFGREKFGVPNRVTARRLHDWAAEKDSRELKIRWFDTHGEQAHFKIVRVVEGETGDESLLVGSANFTIRNLRGQNLESALYLENAGDSGKRFEKVFDKIWGNEGDVSYSTDFESYREDGVGLFFKSAMKFIGDRTGLCTY